MPSRITALLYLASMAEITLQDLRNILSETREKLLNAGGKDGIISRRDVQQLIASESSEVNRSFLEFFYSFLRQLEDRPRSRVTSEVIERGLNFIESSIFPHLEINSNFSERTRQRISQAHPAAYALSQQLMRVANSSPMFSSLHVSEAIAALTDNLFFDDLGSEASEPIQAYYKEGNIQTLSPESFAVSLELDPNNPSDKIERFRPADEILKNFVDIHFSFGLEGQAQAIVDLMNAHLSQLTVIVLGEDYHPDVSAEHPTYVVGIGSDGDLAGFRSIVVWT